MNDKVRTEAPEQAEFRAYCRQWVTDNRPGPPPADRRSKTRSGVMSQAMMDYLTAWQKSAYDAGLVGCDYPKEYGGGGHTDCQRIANQEMQRAGTPAFPNEIALQELAATLLTHGSEELKKRFIPKMFSGEEIWCQGFSEPNAGSDVANAQTFAEKRGDIWVINGQKVWTSIAEFSDWMFLLCRTDRSHKHKGLTYFIVPIKSELGKTVEVRPLVKITGEAGFNEVFFKDLETPDNYRIDEVGKGWSVVITTLMFERDAGGGMVAPAAGGRVSSDASAQSITQAPIIRLAKESLRNGKPAADDPVIRDRIVRMLVRQTGFVQSNRRAGVKNLVDHPMRIPMQVKLVASENHQDLAALAVEIQGAASTLAAGDKNAPYGGTWPYQYISSFGMTIAQGTSEIQRNQIGERVLGMPKTK